MFEKVIKGLKGVVGITGPRWVTVSFLVCDEKTEELKGVEGLSGVRGIIPPGGWTGALHGFTGTTIEIFGATGVLMPPKSDESNYYILLKEDKEDEDA